MASQNGFTNIASIPFSKRENKGIPNPLWSRYMEINITAIPPATKRLLLIKKIKKLFIPENIKIPKNQSQSLYVVGSLVV